ncbi:MAG: hypothetical protein AAF821_09245 [Cyanobacteria bacterium P01_D01_bin.156]
MPASTQNHRTHLRELGCIGIVAVTMLGIGSLWLLAPNWVDNRNPVMQPHMTEVAWDWGQFAPLPPSAEDFQIMTSGSSFSRTFSGSFKAEQVVLERWIQDSPGLNFDQGVQLESGHIRYAIEARNGFGSVELDTLDKIIYFQVSWS